MSRRIDPFRDSRVRHGHKTRAAVTIRTLDAINRTRSLTDAESERLYQAIRDERRHLQEMEYIQKRRLGIERRAR